MNQAPNSPHMNKVGNLRGYTETSYMQTQREPSWLSTMKASLGLGVWDIIYSGILLVSFCEGNFHTYHM